MDENSMGLSLDGAEYSEFCSKENMEISYPSSESPPSNWAEMVERHETKMKKNPTRNWADMVESHEAKVAEAERKRAEKELKARAEEKMREERREKRAREVEEEEEITRRSEEEEIEKRGRKRTVDVRSPAPGYDRSASASKGGKSCKPCAPVDADALKRRQKQIDYGKNTAAYDKYSLAVPRRQRVSRDPRTPPKTEPMSRRQWDGLIKAWKLQIHNFTLSTDEKTERVKEAARSPSGSREPAKKRLFRQSDNTAKPYRTGTGPRKPNRESRSPNRVRRRDSPTLFDPPSSIPSLVGSRPLEAAVPNPFSNGSDSSDHEGDCTEDMSNDNIPGDFYLGTPEENNGKVTGEKSSSVGSVSTRETEVAVTSGGSGSWASQRLSSWDARGKFQSSGLTKSMWADVLRTKAEEDGSGDGEKEMWD